MYPVQEAGMILRIHGSCTRRRNDTAHTCILYKKKEKNKKQYTLYNHVPSPIGLIGWYIQYMPKVLEGLPPGEHAHAGHCHPEEEEEEEFYIHIPGPMWAYWMECSTSTLS